MPDDSARSIIARRDSDHTTVQLTYSAVDAVDQIRRGASSHNISPKGLTWSVNY